MKTRIKIRRMKTVFSKVKCFWIKFWIKWLKFFTILKILNPIFKPNKTIKSKSISLIGLNLSILFIEIPKFFSINDCKYVLFLITPSATKTIKTTHIVLSLCNFSTSFKHFLRKVWLFYGSGPPSICFPNNDVIIIF